MSEPTLIGFCVKLQRENTSKLFFLKKRRSAYVLSYSIYNVSCPDLEGDADLQHKLSDRPLSS